jgi:type IV pilus assembly protein PilW
MNPKLTTTYRVRSSYATGFTLIELLISITLGLLLVAAASQLFIGGVISFRLQQGAADTQDNGLFGLEYIAKDIRIANYGNPQFLTVTDTTRDGGIVLTADTAASVTAGTTTNFTDVRTSNSSSAYVPNGLLTHGAGDTPLGTANQWQGLTKVASGSTASDQLTIQYISPAPMSNCEGGNVLAGDRVVERYFLRADTADSTALVLACDAGSISPKVDAVTADAANGVAAVAYVPPILSNLGDAGQVIMGRVEHFHFLLGTETLAGVWRYYTIHDYMAIAGIKPRIKTIRMAVLVRSTDNTANAAIDPTQTFKMLDQNVQAATTNATTNRYVRRVYSTTIALRNGLGSAS